MSVLSKIPFLTDWSAGTQAVCGSVRLNSTDCKGAVVKWYEIALGLALVLLWELARLWVRDDLPRARRR